jgi:hypothetical protein
MLNEAKTSVFYSRNTGRDFRAYVTSSFGMPAEKGFEKYLGLPTVVQILILVSARIVSNIVYVQVRG